VGKLPMRNGGENCHSKTNALERELVREKRGKRIRKREPALIRQMGEENKEKIHGQAKNAGVKASGNKIICRKF